MVNQEFSKVLQLHQVGISVDDICRGKLDEYLENGLRVFSMCNDGSGRSLNVERALNGAGIPSVRLRGGLKQFTHPENRKALALVSEVVNLVPNIAVILTHSEQQMFSGIINCFRAYRYIDSSGAIESLRRMELSQ